MSFLTTEFEALARLIGLGVAKANNHPNAEGYAETVVSHVKAGAEALAAPVASTVENVSGDVKTEAESVLQKVEGFVEHLLHPDAVAQTPAPDAAPSSTEPPAA